MGQFSELGLNAPRDHTCSASISIASTVKYLMASPKFLQRVDVWLQA